jgi:protein tyrosine phosphatase (PTP) superfamily phosphohydrolase (DUF442 family)
MRPITTAALFLAALLTAVGAFAGEPLGVPNERQPLAGVTTGGTPDAAALERAAAAGYRTVVDLRSDSERDPALLEKAAALGLEVLAIPIGGAADINEASAEKLGIILADTTKRPLLLHCASGNRVGALLALESALVEGQSAEKALTLGLAAGLTGLEPVVRERLGLPEKPAVQ